MATYDLLDGVAGRPGVGSSGTQPPASPASYSGPFLAGMLFSVTGQMAWLEGYQWWVCPSGQSVAAQKFALWNITSTSAQSVVPGSVVTSGPLTAGAMNFVPLATPVQLAPGTLYNAATGWSTVGTTGFPVSNNQFGATQPYASGITNGPLTAWSDLGASHEFPAASLNYGKDQGLFGTASADPSLNMPAGGSNSAIFWAGVRVGDTAPAGYAGSYRFYPNMGDLGNYSLDTANGFTLGKQFSVSQACTVDNGWFFSPPTVTKLPDAIGVYRVSDQALIGVNNSPSWSGAAGSGWIGAAMPGVTLAPGVN